MFVLERLTAIQPLKHAAAVQLHVSFAVFFPVPVFFPVLRGFLAVYFLPMCSFACCAVQSTYILSASVFVFPLCGIFPVSVLVSVLVFLLRGLFTDYLSAPALVCLPRG